MSYACKHCPRGTSATFDAARAAGWRIFSGTTQSGKPLEDVVCPICAGTDPDPDRYTDAKMIWDVQCYTCDWSFSEDWEPGLDPLHTATEAKSCAQEHRCEPQFVYISPTGQTIDGHTNTFQKILDDEAAAARARQQQNSAPRITLEALSRTEP